MERINEVQSIQEKNAGNKNCLWESPDIIFKQTNKKLC